MSFDWNETAVETLTSLWVVGGYSAEAISLRLGITKNAVIGKVHRLGLHRQDTPAKTRRPAKKRKHHRPVEPLLKRIEPISDEIKERMVKDQDRDDLIGIMELDRTTCRWPIGAPVRYCGHDVHPGSVYCQAHHKRAYNAVRPAPKREPSYPAKRSVLA